MLVRSIILGAVVFVIGCDRSTIEENGAQALCALPENRDEKSAGEIEIAAGDFLFGARGKYREEGPATQQSVSSFFIDTTEVTNKEFREFVTSTGYVTVAERRPNPQFLPEGAPPHFFEAGGSVFSIPTGVDTSWWSYVPGANWRHPDGPESTIEGKDNYPVVQVALEDAKAYAKWAGRRLPTEIEWEYAARGGLEAATYEWGEAAPNDGGAKANTWQGLFPFTDTGADGFKGASPVGCYPANGYGLFDMTGNVWEWTQTVSNVGADPTQEPVNVIKGGSFLCAENYCVRYRPAARQFQEVGLSTNHIGFRTVRDVSADD